MVKNLVYLPYQLLVKEHHIFFERTFIIRRNHTPLYPNQQSIRLKHHYQYASDYIHHHIRLLSAGSYLSYLFLVPPLLYTRLFSVNTLCSSFIVGAFLIYIIQVHHPPHTLLALWPHTVCDTTTNPLVLFIAMMDIGNLSLPAVGGCSICSSFVLFSINHRTPPASLFCNCKTDLTPSQNLLRSSVWLGLKVC